MSLQNVNLSHIKAETTDKKPTVSFSCTTAGAKTPSSMISFIGYEASLTLKHATIGSKP